MLGRKAQGLNLALTAWFSWAHMEEVDVCFTVSRCKSFLLAFPPGLFSSLCLNTQKAGILRHFISVITFKVPCCNSY